MDHKANPTTTAQDLSRSIIHVDMDAFYASVEILDNPELAGKPVIVGGHGNRGVVSAASYEARKFGVFSAMPGVQARKRCPHGIFMPVRMSRYKEKSEEVFACFHEFTPHVEGLSVDEAFLDVTGAQRLYGDMETIGRAIKVRIKEKTGLVASIGMAPNKYLAKIASDLDKPDGFCHIKPDAIQSTLDPLPIKRVWGIGPKAAERLRSFGVNTVEDLRTMHEHHLNAAFGNQAEHFWRLARGIDEREVHGGRDEKSVGHEETFREDLTTLDNMEQALLWLSDKVGQRLRRKELKGRTITIKIRQTDFTTNTRSHTLDQSTQHTKEIYDEALQLFRTWHKSHPNAAIRLLGVSMSNFGATNQLNFLSQSNHEKEEKVDSVVDQIRDKFGNSKIKRGRLI